MELIYAQGFMDLLSSGLKRSYTGPVPHSSEPEMARMRSLSTPSPSHLLHPPMGPNYGTHLEVPESSSGRYIIRRHSTGIGKCDCRKVFEFPI